MYSPLFLKGVRTIKTWRNIIDQCVHLGFEKERSYTRNKAAFIEAANWAQNYVAAYARPIIGRYVINHRSLPNAVRNGFEVIFYDGNTPLTYTAQGGKSYYFECDGVGTAEIKDDGGTKTIQLNSVGGFKPYRGFCRGGVTISFSGEYGYMIRNMAVYGSVFSGDEKDIPCYGEYIGYDIAELTKQDGKIVFMGFANDKPVFQGSYESGENYSYVSDYKKEQRSKILLNYNDRGQFEVWYKKYPTPITESTPDDFPLELDDMAADIVPYLMANRMWLDDDGEKAVTYYNLADDMIQQLKLSEMQEKMELASVTEGWGI